MTPWGVCQLCGMTTAAHNHHRKRRSQGGDDSPENLMEVCVSCHNYIHSHVEESYEKGWLVKSWDEPELIVYSETYRAAEIYGEPQEHDHSGKCDRCGIEIKPAKPPRKRLQGEARRKRKTISLKAPADTENGGEVFDEGMALVKEKLVRLKRYETVEQQANFESLFACVHDWVGMPDEWSEFGGPNFKEMIREMRRIRKAIVAAGFYNASVMREFDNWFETYGVKV